MKSQTSVMSIAKKRHMPAINSTFVDRSYGKSPVMKGYLIIA